MFKINDKNDNDNDNDDNDDDDDDNENDDKKRPNRLKQMKNPTKALTTVNCSN